jgi:hypothetical protein
MVSLFDADVAATGACEAAGRGAGVTGRGACAADSAVTTAGRARATSAAGTLVMHVLVTRAPARLDAG